MAAIEVPTFESIFINGRIAIGSTGNMMTAAFDSSTNAGSNPTAPTTGKMPFEHAALKIPRTLLSDLQKKEGPESVRIILNPSSVEWFLDDTPMVVKDIINHPVDYDFDDEDEESYDYNYPDYSKLMKLVSTEVDRLREKWIELEDQIWPSAFSTSFDFNTISTIEQIARVVNQPEHDDNTAIRISGCTPDYHIVRYFARGGGFRNDVFSILGARTSDATTGLSKYEWIPEFAVHDEHKGPFPIWLAHRTFPTDGDQTEVEDELDDDE